MYSIGQRVPKRPIGKIIFVIPFFCGGGGGLIYVHSLMEYGARAQFYIHSVAMVFPAQLAEGGGARPTPLTLSTPSSRVTSAPPTLSLARLSSYLYSPSAIPCHNFLGFLAGRETREVWPLLTVNTEVNGNSKRTNEKGIFLGWFIGLVVPVQEILVSALAALVGPVQNIFFSSSYIISIPLSPSVSKLDRQPCWFPYLLVCVSVAGYAKNSAAEKIILLSAYFCFETKFQPLVLYTHSARWW